MIIDEIREGFGLSERQIETYSPLTLAYIGDCFYELCIRTKLVESAEGSAKTHTKAGTQLAKAVTQARMMHELESHLSEEELAVYKRGRNANISHSAKNASMSEYRTATGFEALMGWLYLTGQDERAFQLVKMGWSQIEK